MLQFWAKDYVGDTNKYVTALGLTSIKETLVASFYDWKWATLVAVY